MSEEEKKAIENLKDFFNEAIKYKSCIIIPYNTKSFDTILNLIEKQQKEIEELKEENKQYKIQEDLTFKCLEKTKYMSNYISKDKIREKIENLENYIQENSDEQGYWGSEHQEDIYAKIEILEELLGE